MTSSTAEPGPWYEDASRWTQLTFVENDPLHFDIDAWRDIMERTRSNALCLSAGGYIAYYPSKIPHHYTSRFLGDRDLFGELVDVARSLGMRVMARIDPHAIHDEAALAHPEWVARGIEGNAIGHPTHRGAWLTCVHSAYYSEFITDVAKELVRDYDVDAVFSNRWSGSVIISHTEEARRRFRNSTGLELPASQNGDPNWSPFAAWRDEQLSGLLDLWDRSVRDIKPDARFIPNLGPFRLRALSPDLMDRTNPLMIVDKQGRWGMEANWASGRVGKRSKGLYPDRPVALITSIGPEQHRHRWKDAVDSPAELTMALADGILHEASPWFTKFNAKIVDSRWVEPIARAMKIHERIEPYYRRSVAQPEVVILDSSTPREILTLEGMYATPDEEAGFYHALVEARIPFGYLPDFKLTPERLEGVRVIVIPDVDALGDDQIAALETFAKRGGSIVASDRSSLSSDEGVARDDFGLAALLGIRRVGLRREKVQNNYVAISADHPVGGGFGDARRIIGGTAVIPIESVDESAVPFRFVPDFPDLPMEEVYPREEPRDPAIVCRELPSGGRVAYVAFNLGAIYWEAMQQDHGRLIENLVDWALHGRRGVRLDGRGLIDVALRRTEVGAQVGLVNLDNSQSMRGQMHWIRTSESQTLRLRAPEDAQGASVTHVVAGREQDVDVLESGELEVVVPPFDVLELIDVRWRR